LKSFDAIVTNVANSYRLQEECDVISLRMAKIPGAVPWGRAMGAVGGNPDVFPIEKLGFSKNIGISIRTRGFKLEKIGISLGFH
jgi:hypothetical protein